MDNILNLKASYTINDHYSNNLTENNIVFLLMI